VGAGRFKLLAVRDLVAPGIRSRTAIGNSLIL
jgi:hypothetical protein